MKKITLIALLYGGLSFGQIQTPQPSPFAKIEQVVGLTDVKITYSRYYFKKAFTISLKHVL